MAPVAPVDHRMIHQAHKAYNPSESCGSCGSSHIPMIHKAHMLTNRGACYKACSTVLVIKQGFKRVLCNNLDNILVYSKDLQEYKIYINLILKVLNK